MLGSLLSKRDKLKEKYKSGNVLQKGFTLLEVLAVVVIILILLGIVVATFTFFGRVDGTELNAESKQVESAVLQASLADDERGIPGIAIEADETAPRVGTGDSLSEGDRFTRTNTTAELVAGVDSDNFYTPDQAAYVINEIAQSAGLDGNDLVALMRPVDPSLQDSVAGNAELEVAEEPNYFVVLKKSQLYSGEALNHFDGYNDSLAGMVFSRDTIIDNDSVFYNGSHNVKSVSGDETAATGLGDQVFVEDASVDGLGEELTYGHESE